MGLFTVRSKDTEVRIFLSPPMFGRHCEHNFTKWDDQVLFQERRCTICGWTERVSLPHWCNWEEIDRYGGSMYHYYLFKCKACGKTKTESL